MRPLSSHPLGSIDPRGSAAREIADLWWLMAIVGLAVFLVVVTALIVGFRRSAEQPDDESSSARRWLLLGGIALPSVVIAGILVATVSSMDALSYDPDDTDLTIEIVGHQWWWEVRYPDAGIVTANEIHIPAGRLVDLRLRSADVIHSFWVPGLAGKMDLLPEHENSLIIDADRPGTFRGHCAEFCGIQHANMRLLVVAHDDTDFDDWLSSQRQPAQRPSSPEARRGAELFVTEGCAGCHTVSGTPADGADGPDLTHFASRTSIGAGTVDLTEPDLVEWISDPHAIKEGVLMPTVELTADEVGALVVYLSELR